MVITFERFQWWLLKEQFVCVGRLCSLTAKSAQNTALSFQSVHHIHGSLRTQTYFRLSLVSAERDTRQPEVRLRSQATSMAVTVFLLACSVYVTASRITFSRKTLRTPRLLVDQARDSLDTASASKTTDGWLGGDALDVFTKDLSVTLRASFSWTFAPVTATDVSYFYFEKKKYTTSQRLHLYLIRMK